MTGDPYEPSGRWVHLMSLAFKAPLSIALSAAAFSGFSVAQDWYVSGQVQWQKQQDSTNKGTFNEESIIGIDTLTLTTPDGTQFNPDTYNYQWETAFDPSIAGSVEIGTKLPNGFRGSLEFAYEQADINTHDRGAISLSGVADTDGNGFDANDPRAFTAPDTLDSFLFDDGGELTTFDGTPVADAVLRQGTNSIVNLSAFANLYYDFALSKRIKPYIGAGIGVTQSEVEFAPDGVTVTETDSTRFAYQAKAGTTVQITEKLDLFAEYAYRATSDLKATFTNDSVIKIDIENKRHLAGIGFRYRFES